MMNPKIKKQLELLPNELQSIYKRLVSEYQYHCVVRFGRAFVSYEILADLVKDGWRPTHEQFLDPEKPIMKQFEFK